MKAIFLLNLIATSILFYHISCNMPTCESSIRYFANKYRCINTDKGKLGEGASGVAYLIEDVGLQKNRVLKVGKIRRKPIINTPMYALHNKINGSKYIIERFDIKADTNYTYEILEYASRGSLATYIRKFNYTKDQKEILELFKKIATGISEMHKKDVIHADIKPDNIVIEENGEPRIIDFDISVEANTEATSRGTPPYIAPEIVYNFGKGVMLFKKEIDIWSLGVTLYEMLYLKTPFSVRYVDKKFITSYQTINFYENTSIEIINIILMMLKEDPRQRASIDNVLLEIDTTLNKPNWTFEKGNLSLLTSVTSLQIVNIEENNEKVSQIVSEKILTRNAISEEQKLNTVKTNVDLDNTYVKWSIFGISGGFVVLSVALIYITNKRNITEHNESISIIN